MNTVRCSNRLCEKEYNVQFDKCPFCGTPNPMEESERKTMIEKSKTTDIRNSSSDESLFNGWVTGIIWVNIIFFGARGIISSFTNMIFSPLIGCITLGLSIVGIISMLYILRAKKWAFFLWIAYRIAGAIVVSIINPKFSLTAHIIFAVVNILVMIAVLQIKKNSVSAWSVIFSKHKTSTRSKKAHHIIKRRNDTHNSEPSKTEIKATNEPTESLKVGETQCALKENVLSAPIPTPATNELQEEILPIIIPNEQPVEKNVHNQTNEIGEKPRKERCKKKTLKYNKWWLYLIIIVGILAIALLAVWLSHRLVKPKLGEYVYVDNYSILHIDRNCNNIADYRGTKPISIYSLNELTHDKWKHICSNCITDNSYKIIQRHVIGNENLRAIYNILKTENYTPPAFEQFVKDMQEDSNLRGVYATLQKEGYITPPFFDFIANLGFDAKLPPLRKVDYRKSNLRNLYDFFIEENYDVPNDYVVFERKLTNDLDACMRVYRALKRDGYTFMGTEECFIDKLFQDRTILTRETVSRTFLGLYMELKRISDETNLDFGIDKYTYQQFCEKYGSKEGLSNLYDALSCIAAEEGIDFNLGNKEEWIASFETDY